METKQQVINQVINTNKYLQICKRLLNGNPLYKDLYQEFVLELLETPEQRFQNIQCQDCYLYRFLLNMTNSKTSKFYYKYKRKIDPKEIQAEKYDYSIDIKAKVANNIINKLPYHDKVIVDSWVNGKSETKISNENNIPRYFVSKKIKTINEKIKQELKMQEAGQLKVLLVIQKQITALQYHRQYIPHLRLTQTNQHFKVMAHNGEGDEANIDDMSDNELQEYQIIYFLRQISFNYDKSEKTLNRLKRLGLKIVMDIDDYWVLPQEHHWHKLYTENKVAENVINCIKKVDHVITTTKFFADKIKDYNSNVTVIPNCISPEDKQFEHRKIDSPFIRFGWVGGVFHVPDIKMIEETFSKINKIGKDFKDNIQLSVGGFSCNYEYKEIEKVFTDNYSFRYTDKTYYNYLQQCTPSMEHISLHKTYRRLWGRDVREYGQLYNEIDVALVPLKDNTFNKCKSELKIVEAGWMKKAVICSRVTPYQEYIKHEKNGILVNQNRNNIDWYLAIRRLTLNPNLVSDMGEALNETIKEHFDIDKHNQTRAELYKSLL